MEKTKQILAAMVYALGAVATGILFLLWIVRCDIVLFPDAMLPMRLWEQAAVWLAWGTLPMGIAGVLFYRSLPVSGKEAGSRKVACIAGIFLPVAVCVCFLAYWLVVGICMFF